MKKKILAVMGIALAAGILSCGCSSKKTEDTTAAATTAATAETTEAATTAAETTQAETTAEAETTEAATTAEAETTEAEKEESSVYEQDLQDYDEIISGLKSGQFYAFGDFDKDHDVLLVTDETFDNLDGSKASITAELYAFDKDGSIISYGTVSSTGTAYPLSTKDGYLYSGGHHEVSKVYIDESLGSVMTYENASETFDSNGNATYYYMSQPEETEGEVEDDSNMRRLSDEYANATIISFAPVEQ